VATKQKQVLLDARRANVYAADTGHEGAKRIVYVPTHFTQTGSRARSNQRAQQALLSRAGLR